MSQMIKSIVIALIIFLLGLGITTYKSLSHYPKSSLSELYNDEVQIKDRHKIPLNYTYQSKYNIYDKIDLFKYDKTLINALIISEDKRFYSHKGTDLKAKLGAFLQNIKASKIIRGGSTITEQVVRIINPRPRNVWSKWLEMWEALILEKRFKKDEILQFYMNQVPFASNRKGFAQASKYYFGRSLSTLKKEEMLALVVLVRSPSSFDPRKNVKALKKRVLNLSYKLNLEKYISEDFDSEIKNISLNSDYGKNIYVSMPSFIRYLKSNRYTEYSVNNELVTTIDVNLQLNVQELLEKRLKDLNEYKIENGAVLVVNYKSGEILSWAVAGDNSKNKKGSFYDAVTVKRQPGSTLKPFVYSLAFDRGLSPDDVIEDAPIYSEVRNGLHVFKNYSKKYYGDLNLAKSLSNSLNIPAVKMLNYVGLENFILKLKEMGIEVPNKNKDFYGDGIILGNMEISLYDMVNAYSCLANFGVCNKIKVIKKTYEKGHNVKAFDKSSAIKVSQILSDNRFRKLEFGSHGVLDFPYKTAVKTGTSARSNDLWTFAYDGEYIVGVWLGNINRDSPKKQISGAVGPALLVRSIFNEIHNIYSITPLDVPDLEIGQNQERIKDKIEMVVPSNDMDIIYDIRIPKNEQKIGFYITGLEKDNKVLWLVNNKEYKTYSNEKLYWQVKRGSHNVSAMVFHNDKLLKKIPRRNFLVR